MKNTIFASLFFSILLALNLAAQTPSVAPPATVSPSPTATTTTSPAEDSDDDADTIERGVKRHFNKHINITFDRHHHRNDSSDMDINPSDFTAIPIVGIVFTTLFGAPVLVVAAIMFFSYLRSRSLHRTVRMMVEKGQPVPPELFTAPPRVRARSDMRRGVVLTMIGLGLMLFFGAVSDGEGGAWAIGLIPFMIGVGYLVVWKLEGGKNPPPPPVAPPPLP